MGLPNREGRFKAQVIDKGVAPSGDNKLTTLTVRFALYHELGNDGQWYDVQPEGLEITGYFYIEKKDGSLNEFTIEALKETFGWDGRDVFWLEDSELPDCQVTLGFDEYKGKNRIRVQFINNLNSEPQAQVAHSDANSRRAIQNRLGAKLRAMSGGSSVPKKTPPPPPAKPSAPPAAPPRPATPPPPAQATSSAADNIPAANPNVSNADEAWGAFVEHARSNNCTDDAHMGREWYRIITEVRGKSDIEQMTPEDWHWMKTEGLKEILPF